MSLRASNLILAECCHPSIEYDAGLQYMNVCMHTRLDRTSCCSDTGRALVLHRHALAWPYSGNISVDPRKFQPSDRMHVFPPLPVRLLSFREWLGSTRCRDSERRAEKASLTLSINVSLQTVEMSIARVTKVELVWLSWRRRWVDPPP